MKRNVGIVVFVAAEIVIFSCTSFAQFTGVRELPSDGSYTPGAPISVIINISGGPGEITVMENPPEAWVVQEALWNGVVTETGTIIWNLSLVRSSTSVRYVILPTRATQDDVEFSGTVGNFEITGDAVLTPAVLRPLGVFENHITLGANGTASYDSETETYIVTSEHGGGGYKLYREVHERGALRARMHVEEGVDFSAFIMFSDTLEGPAPFYTAVITLDGDGLIGWELPAGSGYRVTELVSSEVQDGWFEIERNGNTFSASYYDISEQRWIRYHSLETEVFSSPVYLGIGAWTSKPGGTAVGRFTDVEFKSAEEIWELYE